MVIVFSPYEVVEAAVALGLAGDWNPRLLELGVCIFPSKEYIADRVRNDKRIPPWHQSCVIEDVAFRRALLPIRERAAMERVERGEGDGFWFTLVAVRH